MTILYGAAQGVAAIKAEALAIHNGKVTKYHLRAGGEYLHFSGLKLTTNRDQAWVGTVAQGRACRRRFDAAAGCKLRSIQPLPTRSEEV